MLTRANRARFYMHDSTRIVFILSFACALLVCKTASDGGVSVLQRVSFSFSFSHTILAKTIS